MDRRPTKPKPLRPGDVIGICAPAGPVPTEELQRGIALLHARGYRTKVAKDVYTNLPPFPYLANEDNKRFQGLNSLLKDDEVGLILCARGGYGSQRLYPLFTPLPKRFGGKILCGYSDITGLHNALRGTIQRLHGPNLSTLLAMDKESQEWFWRLLEAPETPANLPQDSSTIDVLVEGQATGLLEGGNLCLLAHSCGTQFHPQFDGCIVLLEDVGEPLYRIDRYLTQLLNSGSFSNVAGFVLGTVTPAPGTNSGVEPNQLNKLWCDRLSPLNVPIVAGLRFGHVENPLAMPLGVRTELNATARVVTLCDTITSV